MDIENEPVVVVPITHMDDETFKMHFVHRHGNHLPGLDGFVEPTHPDTIESYRIFHETIHRLSLPNERDHIHEDG